MKYFYTDPLAAAWMAKHFGMLFTPYHDDPPLAWEPSEDWPYRDRYYIYSDSLRLLEPDVGDIVFESAHGTVYPYEVTIEGFSQMGYFSKKPLKYNGAYYVNGKIIQRNDIPFMCPQCEP